MNIMSAMNKKTLKMVNTGFFAAMVIVNALANLIPIGIGSTGAVSEKYANLFTPAPITFAIWGLIYLMMLLFVLYQWGLFGSKARGDNVAESIGLWFAVSCTLNIGWIFAWHFDVIWLSMIMIAGLLGSLIMISRRLALTERKGFAYFSVNAGFDLYLGWIIVATVANVCVFFTSIGWLGFGGLSETFVVVQLFVAATISAALTIIGRKWFADIAMVWAFTGILIKQIGQSGYAGEHPAVIGAAIAGIIIMLSAVLIKMYSKKCSACRKARLCNWYEEEYM